MTKIRCQTEQDDLIMVCGNRHQDYRQANDWLIIEKNFKGEKWFAIKARDRGLLLTKDEKGKSFWLYETEYEIVTERPTEPPRLYYADTPFYIKVLRHEIEDFCEAIPYHLIRLFDEVKEKKP